MEKEKISQAIEILRELKIDLWLTVEAESEVLQDPIVDYIVGEGVTWLSFFMLFVNGEKIAIVGNLDQEKIEKKELFDRVFAYKTSVEDDFFRILKEFKPHKIALNFSEDSPVADGLTFGKWLKLQNLLKKGELEVEIVSAEGIISRLRGRKSPEEIKRISEAVKITEKIFDQVTVYARPGMSEKQIAEFITAERKKIGLPASWDEDSCPSVFTGPQTSGAHFAPSDKLLAPGHVFNIDFGVVYQRYCSDLQRTWYIRKSGEKKAPAIVEKAFEVLVSSIQLAKEVLKPGVIGKEIDALARQYIVKNGYGEYPHALGHQVGRKAHDGGGLLAPEWERYGKLPFVPVEAGQVYTIEPRIYLEDFGVVTVEEMVVVNERGAEFISTPQQKIFLI